MHVLILSGFGMFAYTYTHEIFSAETRHPGSRVRVSATRLEHSRGTDLDFVQVDHKTPAPSTIITIREIGYYLVITWVFFPQNNNVCSAPRPSYPSDLGGACLCIGQLEHWNVR